MKISKLSKISFATLIALGCTTATAADRVIIQVDNANKGIITALTKQLGGEVKVDAVSFDSVPARAAVKMVTPDNLDELVRLLHEEAKVI